MKKRIVRAIAGTTRRVVRALGLDGILVVGWLCLVALGALSGLVLGACGPKPVPVCEPASSRCNGTARVEVCTPEGQWMLADQCGDFGPGAWECGQADGSVAACMPREIVDPR